MRGQPSRPAAARAAVVDNALPPGEMARRVREFDWSATPIGPRRNWSPNLHVTAELVLASGFPMAVRWGPDLVSIYNDAYCAILADKHPDALGRPLREVWAEIYDELGPLNQAIMRGERPAYFEADRLWRVRRRAGEYEDAHFTICYSPVPDASAAHGIGGILVSCVETTERVRTEQALRRLNDTLEAEVAERTRERDRIWQVSEDLLGVSNFEGYFISVNPAWTSLLGWSEEEIKQIHVNNLRHPDDAAHSIAGRQQLAAGVPTVRMENRFRHKDGSWRWIYWTLTVEQGLIYVIGRHVSAEKEATAALQRAQQQLAETQKLEAIAELTGGIAHDFNNMLMIVDGNAELLKRRLATSSDRRAIEAIEHAAARGESLTRQLLTFSRRQTLKPSVIDLGQRLMEVRDVLASSARANVELTIDIPADTWPVAIDVAEFELALVNIVVNARDAMPAGGTVNIAAKNVQLRPGDTRDDVSGDFVALAIADNGSGIVPEILPRVFEPFFTTKGRQHGTGLGLSQVYGFTRQSGGTVTIVSEPGRGATVTLYLPRSTALPAVEPEPRRLEQAAQPGETVLLVEDNVEVQAVAASLLEQLGYQVRQTENASSALQLLAAGQPVDLVFSDIVMPGELDGLGLARRIERDYPQVKVLLTTGYADAAAAAEPGFPILRKPYRLAALGDALREALDRQPGAAARSASV
ncbi:MAG TPA: ATP-binding protein [Stellaceae bacterium]|jgi:PAS domain S-box-containing protein|nr:ATP-binding protein [Stellaceae bacterium]